jgi:hypothetical protein
MVSPLVLSLQISAWLIASRGPRELRGYFVFRAFMRLARVQVAWRVAMTVRGLTMRFMVSPSFSALVAGPTPTARQADWRTPV